jgi:hypothetical protein
MSGDVVGIRQRILDRNKEHNNSVLERMRAGEGLALVPAKATWFPPKGTFSRELGRMVCSKEPEKETEKEPEETDEKEK